MTANDTPPVSRRQASVLAAALAATVVTAIAAIGGFSHWNAQAAPTAAPPSAVQVVRQAPAPAAPHWTESD